MATDGKTNPEAELLKNIEVLFDQSNKPQDPNEHPACKFPLRYEWIRQQLNLNVPAHEELNCPNFTNWISALGATGVNLIFASSYTNNPASMFGHTFLKLTRVQNKVELPDMLHYTVNFAADTGSEKGFLYTIKGLFGAYPGTFSTMPYYIKIQQYNNFESRDLWEYALNISPEQLHKIVFHLWEMGSTYFDYYFGDENCSYFLLALLEEADDEVYLRKHLPFFIIPMDTLKVVGTKTNWIQDIHYRPSLERRYQSSYKTFNKLERKIFDDVVILQNTETLKNVSPESQGKIVDTAMDYLAVKEKENTKTDFQKKLLTLRSENPATYIAPEMGKPGDPLSSHPSSRFGVGGSRMGGRNFAHFDFRGAHHDVLDNSSGFDPGAQIQILEGRIRVATHNGDVALDHLKLIEVVSMSPKTKYLSKTSWNIGFGWRKNYSDECFDCGAAYVEGGPGITLGTSGERRFYFTVFGNGFFQAGPWNQTGYQVGPSGTSILTMDLNKRQRLMISGNARYSPFGSPNFIYKGSVESSLELSKTWSMRWWANLYSQSHEFGGSLLYYF